MRRTRGPIVIKLGGSHAFSPHLRDWLDALARCAGRIVVVPGGGPFSDAVRSAQPRMGFDDRAAHRMALLAMEQYACALASLDPALVLCDSRTGMRRALAARKVPVWCPTKMTLRAADVPWSWDVTSDSLAAWLSGHISARRMLLVKHLAPFVDPVSADDLVARDIVDPAFPRMLGAADIEAYVTGPSDHAGAAAAIRTGATTGARIVLQ
jgi:5-(aminomethyl)-3-furanmethanol phosphate kinase